MAQPISFGVKGGLPLTDLLNATSLVDTLGPAGFSNYTSMTSPYIVGPTVEGRLPLGLTIEFDALYRHLNYTDSFFTCALCEASEGMTKTRAGDWEFPLLLKYRFPTKRVRPYVDIGVAAETLMNLAQTGFTQTVPLFGAVGPPMNAATSTPAELNDRAVAGFVTGAGVDIHLLFLHFSPEIRYTRWGAQQFVGPSGVIPPGSGPSAANVFRAISSNQNQVEFLLGITF